MAFRPRAACERQHKGKGPTQANERWILNTGHRHAHIIEVFNGPYNSCVLQARLCTADRSNIGGIASAAKPADSVKLLFLNLAL
jgi:3-dehydroquinate synthetase